MKRLLAAALLIGAAPPADGQWSDATPPVRYQGGSVSIVMTVPSKAIAVACGISPPPGYVILACTRALPDGTPIVIMPNPIESDATDQYAHLFAHELGHRNGWGSLHER